MVEYYERNSKIELTAAHGEVAGLGDGTSVLGCENIGTVRINVGTHPPYVSFVLE